MKIRPKKPSTPKHPKPKIHTEGGIVAFDTETTGLDFRGKDRPYLFTFTDYEGNSSAVWGSVDPFTREVSFPPQNLEAIREVLENENITKVCHNAKFDLNMARAIGIETKGKVIDTLIMAHVQNSGRQSFGLKPLADELFGHSQDDMKDLKKEVSALRRKIKKEKWGWMLGSVVETDYWMIPELCETYGIGDTERTMQLYWAFEELYNSDEAYKNTVDMEHELLWVTRAMEDRGIKIDRDVTKELRDYYQGIIDESKAKIEELGYADLNIDSPLQMKKVFYDDMGMEPERRSRKSKAKGRYESVAVDGKALDKWAKQGNELAKQIVRLREAEQQLDGFIKTFEDTWVIDEHDQSILHPSYRTCGPVTGRISCTKPNLMNISNPGEKKSDVKSRVRECFVPRTDKDYVLYFADYSQVEVWVAMYVSQDEFGMSQLESGEDMHGTMAKKIWGKQYDFSDEAVFKKWRKRAKFVLFGLIYGAGIPAVMDAAGCSETEAKSIRDVFWNTFKGLKAFSEKLKVEVDKRGYITNPFGRDYHISPSEAYKALNYMVQGTAAEIMKRALINIHNRLKRRVTRLPKAHLLLTIHDEVCVEAHKKDKEIPRIIVECMQGEFHTVLGLPCKVQAEVSIAPVSWAMKKEMEIQFND